MSKFVTAPYKEPDHEKKKRKGQLWCPYCGEWHFFKFNRPLKLFKGQTSSYRRCENCNMSIEDFWVKTVNKLWETFKVKRK
jgi:DNA-directed RNA polymerase subunit RPC12/RpoP